MVGVNVFVQGGVPWAGRFAPKGLQVPSGRDLSNLVIGNFCYLAGGLRARGADVGCYRPPQYLRRVVGVLVALAPLLGRFGELWCLDWLVHGFLFGYEFRPILFFWTVGRTALFTGRTGRLYDRARVRILPRCRAS